MLLPFSGRSCIWSGFVSKIDGIWMNWLAFKAFKLDLKKQSNTFPVKSEGKEYKLAPQLPVTAAVISCTNNCNLSVMPAAGLLAKKAIETSLTAKLHVRTGLLPGSGMVIYYLSSSRVSVIIDLRLLALDLPFALRILLTCQKPFRMR